MLWTQAQNRLFRAAEHDAGIARSHGLTQEKAGEMAREGIKKSSRATSVANASPKQYAAALRRNRPS